MRSYELYAERRIILVMGVSDSHVLEEASIVVVALVFADQDVQLVNKLRFHLEEDYSDVESRIYIRTAHLLEQ